MAKKVTVQIQPSIPPELKAQLDALCQERNVFQGDVVTTALQQYFGDVAEDESKLDVIGKQLATLVSLVHLLLEQREPATVTGGPVSEEEPPTPAWTTDGRVLAAGQGMPTRQTAKRRWPW